MSERRIISFTNNESDLLNYFDNNGKSDVIKKALRFYIKNKDKKEKLSNSFDIDKFSDIVVNKLVNVVGKDIKITNIIPIEEKINKVENKIIQKGMKLFK